MSNYPQIDLTPYIDHSILNTAATPELIQRYCQESDRFNFPTVCVLPIHIPLAIEYLRNSKVKVCSMIGFPSGAHTTNVKLYEAQEAVENGAKELDIVINWGWLKQGKTEAVYQEIALICQETGQTVKAILETSQLTNEEKKIGAEICLDAGVAFLKTSTGWFGGATVEDIKLLKEVTKGNIGIKASGGIRTIEQAIDLIVAGATRLGTSYGILLLEQLANSKKSESNL